MGRLFRSAVLVPMTLHFDLESTRMCVTPNASEPGSASCEYLETVLSVPLHHLRRLHYRHRSYYAYEGATMKTSYLGLNLGAACNGIRIALATGQKPLDVKTILSMINCALLILVSNTRTAARKSSSLLACGAWACLCEGCARNVWLNWSFTLRMGSSADVAGQGMLSRVGSAKTKRSSDRPAAPTAETIWVGVRIRPLSYLEHIHRDHDSWEASDEFTLRYIGEVDRSHAHLPPAYCYDRVFSNHTSSQQVYDAAAKDRVLSALQGLNATLFVYGQTGSGKTYTMRSVVQAAAQDIFHHIRHTPGMSFYTLELLAVLLESGSLDNIVCCRKGVYSQDVSH